MASTRKNSYNGLTFAGILAGAAIGAAVGLVYTPRSGEDNRARVAGWAGGRAEKARTTAQQALEGARDKAGQTLEQAQGKAQQAVEQAQTRAQQAAGQARSLAPGS